MQECLWGQDILTLSDKKGKVKLVPEHSTARRGSGEFVIRSNLALHLLYCIHTLCMIKALLHSYGEEKVQHLNLEQNCVKFHSTSGICFYQSWWLTHWHWYEMYSFHCVFVVFSVLASSILSWGRVLSQVSTYINHVEKQSTFFTPKLFCNYSVHSIRTRWISQTHWSCLQRQRLALFGVHHKMIHIFWELLKSLTEHQPWWLIQNCWDMAVTPELLL